MSVILVTGPARSGKSRWAETLAQQSHRPVIYIATALPADPQADPEWYHRIQNHRQRRPHHWQTWEIPQDLAGGIDQLQTQHCGLVDSLGSWTANGLDREDQIWNQQVRHLIDHLQRCPSLVILVAEEVGWGVVPAYPMGRIFRDRLGELAQAVGTIADQIYLVVAGQALDLKHWGSPVPPAD